MIKKSDLLKNSKRKRIVRVPLPLAETMRLLLEGSSVSTWFGASHANIDPRKGGKYEIYWQPDSTEDSTKDCLIMELEPDRLVIQWRGPTKHDSFPGMEKPGSTTVEFQLETDGDSTVILIDHRGLDTSTKLVRAQKYYDERWKIWAHNLDLLGAIAGKVQAVNDMARRLIRETPKPASSMGFIPKPGKGERKAFDFSKITLDSEILFGNPHVMRNVVDQA